VTKHTSSYPSSVVLVVLVTPSLLFYLVAPGWVPGALISPGSCLCVGRVYKYALCLPDWRAQYSLVALSLGYMSRPLLSGLVRLVLVSFIDRVDKYVLAVPAWRTQYSLVTLALGYVLRPLLSEVVNLEWTSTCWRCLIGAHNTPWLRWRMDVCQHDCSLVRFYVGAWLLARATAIWFTSYRVTGMTEPACMCCGSLKGTHTHNIAVLRWRLVACQGHCYLFPFVSGHRVDRVYT
jgi:hypothetical protein